MTAGARGGAGGKGPRRPPRGRGQGPRGRGGGGGGANSNEGGTGGGWSVGIGGVLNGLQGVAANYFDYYKNSMAWGSQKDRAGENGGPAPEGADAGSPGDLSPAGSSNRGGGAGPHEAASAAAEAGNSTTAGADSRGRSGSASCSMEWKFQQSFGETVQGEEVLDADIISRLEFDRTGEHLASGDRGGRVVLFKACNRDEADGFGAGPPGGAAKGQPWYKYLTEFQSHEPEFDYLKSHEILEKINQVRWCHGAAGSQTLLTTNDKKVKMWKVSEQNVQFCTNFNLRESMETSVSPPASPMMLGSPSLSPRPAAVFGLSGSLSNVFCGDRATIYGERALSSPSRMSADGGAATPSKGRGVTNLKVPTTRTKEKVISARCRRIYCNAHAYHINSIALSSDGETFISADDLTINLWHVDVPTHGYHIVNMKPNSFEELTELITCADFHPHDCSTFCYSSSKGSIRLADLRETAVCGSNVKMYEEAVSNKSFFSEITSSISDCKFSRCGRYLVSRDYMTVKIWDLKMERAPISTMKVHEHLRSKLGDLYESNCIFDKFDCCLGPNGDHVATGSYSNIMRVFGVNSGTEHVLECSMTPQRFNAKQPGSKETSRLGLGRLRRDSRARAGFGQGFTGELDTSAKILNMAWHPQQDVLAVASTNSLYFFNSFA